jgi:hypothetical protein
MAVPAIYPKLGRVMTVAEEDWLELRHPNTVPIRGSVIGEGQAPRTDNDADSGPKRSAKEDRRSPGK